MAKELTKGSPFKLLIWFFLPMMGSLLFQQIYNIADSIIVGQLVGAKALAAVGSTGSVNFLFLGFVNGICAGATIPVARCFGAKNYPDMRRAVANGTYFITIVSLLVTALTLILLRQLLTLMRYPADIFNYSYQYLAFTFGGAIFTAFYNFTANLLRAVGDSRTPLIGLIIACVVNIGLNFTFVMMGMKVIGVALATMIAQLFSAVFCSVFIFKKLPVLVPRGDEKKWNGSQMKNIASLSLPMGLQLSITALGTIIVQTAVNGFGTLKVTAMTVSNKVCLIFMDSFFNALGISMVNYVSQNLGAGRIDRVRSGIKAAWKIAAVLLLFTIAVLVLLGKFMMGLFINGGEADRNEILMFGYRYMIAAAVCFPCVAMIHIYRNTIQGLGYSKIAMFGGLVELLSRVFVLTCFVGMLGFDGVIIASPFAWVATGSSLMIVYTVLIRRMTKKQAIKE